MDRMIAAALATVLILGAVPARAGDAREAAGSLAALQDSFRSHKVGEPFLDASGVAHEAELCGGERSSCEGLRSALLRARHVQEGCAQPCASEVEVALYRAAIGLVCEDLLMPDCRPAEDNYIRDGKPRKRDAGVAGGAEGARLDALAAQRLLADPRLDPGLRGELGEKALALAAALGKLQWVDGDGSPAVFAGEKARGRANLTLTQAAPLRPEGAAVPAAIPIAEVESRLRSALNEQIGKYPTGAALLKEAAPIPELRFRKDDDETVASYDVYSGALYINSVRAGAVIKKLDPAAAKVPLDEPEAVKAYLSRHPELLPGLARQFDVVYVHELTHRVQHARHGDNFFGRWLDSWKQILSGGKHPIESEWESFGAQNRYFGERSRAEPEILDYRNSPELGLFEYEDYVRDLKAYRRSKTSEYQKDCAPADQLKLFRGDKARYDRVLGAEDKGWNQASFDGNMGLARHWARMRFPAQAIDYLEAALDRAGSGGFLDKKKPEMAALFKAVVEKMEEAFKAAKPGSPGPNLGPSQKETLRKLGAALGAPLPPRLAEAVGRKE